MSNEILRTTLTNGGKTLPPSWPPAAALRCRTSSTVPDGSRPSLTPATSQPGAVTTARRGRSGNAMLTVSTAGSGPRIATRCTPAGNDNHATSV